MEKAVTRNPADGALLREYRVHDARQREQILGDAAATQRAWGRQEGGERAAALGRLAAVLRARSAELSRLATQEMGKPLAQSVKEVEKCAAACEYYAEKAPGFLADEVVAGSAAGVSERVVFRPLGVILAIMPWNFPYWQAVRCAAPAIAAGNAVILKHADITTGSALALAAAFEASGMPPGLMRALVSGHDELKSVIADERVRAVSLTGSERAGAAVAALAGQHLKKTVLELGGSDAYVVLGDADAEAAAKICVEARLVNNGQSCVAAKRFIVADAVFSRFQAVFVELCRGKRLGDPLAADTDIGPLARADLRAGVAKQVDQSVAQGAQLLLGGKLPAGAGFYYPVTVLSGVTPGMAAFDEEVFGPVAAIVRAKDDGEALALANRSRYGLGGAIFSRDTARAERLARLELDAGFVVVNGQVVSDPRLPFGGVKFSGYGRELAAFGLREFVNVKTVVVHG